MKNIDKKTTISELFNLHCDEYGYFDDCLDSFVKNIIDSKSAERYMELIKLTEDGLGCSIDYDDEDGYSVSGNEGAYHKYFADDTPMSEVYSYLINAMEKELEEIAKEKEEIEKEEEMIHKYYEEMKYLKNRILAICEYAMLEGKKTDWDNVYDSFYKIENEYNSETGFEDLNKKEFKKLYKEIRIFYSSAVTIFDKLCLISNIYDNVSNWDV